MDIMDEVLQPQRSDTGKMGFNQSDKVKGRQMLANGWDADQIAHALNVNRGCVDLYIEKGLLSDKPKKKAKKKVDDDQG